MEKSTFGPLALIGAIVLGALYLAASRAGLPDDGTPNAFILALAALAPRAEVGDLYWVEVTVANPGTAVGRMYVQCSLLDATTRPWLATLVARDAARGAITKLPTTENCVADEPFTQTANVTLAAGASTTVNFTVTVPNTLGLQTYAYCAAYERCWTETQDSLESSHITRAVTIVAADSSTANDNANEYGKDCTTARDCKTLGFFGTQICDTGHCMNAPTDAGADGGTATPSWVATHRSYVLLGIFALLFLGVWYVYRPPKKPPLPFLP